VQTVQRDGICREVLAPAPGLAADRAEAAQSLALRIAAELDVTGLLAVELFDTPGGLLVNELAMRPHNCGHWTIEGAVTSQFEQHLRAVLDLPLGAPGLLAPQVVLANLLGGTDPDVYDRYIHVMAADPGLKVHLYGKAVRRGRKIGHVTVLGDDVAELRDRARRAASFLRWGTEDGDCGWPGTRSRSGPDGRQHNHEPIATGRRRHGQRFGLAGDACGRGHAGRIRRCLRG
jgi:5-(carboxyamino)imidazole ribonucleotide synthase